ncbi:MAG: pyruvate kinase [Actinomycetota bacterium]|nr:pyruvate kinase [Actinomycetota bacterium]
MRRAKIVCTLGPATADPAMITSLVVAGMDVARLNLSHGTKADHERAYDAVRAAGDATGRSVAVLVDLQGPKIRLGSFASGPVLLADGDPFTITTEAVPGDRTICSTTYQYLADDLEVGDRILLDDGKVVLEVSRVDGRAVETIVQVGGELSDHKGINLPGVAVSTPALTEKDIEDLRWALHLRADMVALSFVRSAADLERVREVMAQEGVRLPVIAKIEKPEAVAQLEDIIDAFDAIMVARGDLGVELALEQVPVVQKRALQLARRRARPSIVATQMLESMITNPRPTRAEASDVANAVLDGADAVMLSGETSVGRHPIRTVQTMARIIEYVEDERLDLVARMDWEPRTVGGAITHAAVQVADRVDARFLVAFTQSGDTVRRIARYRTAIPLLAFTPVADVRSQLALTWGVEAFLVPYVEHTDDMVRQVERAMLELGRCIPGDRVVIVAGSPPGAAGSTNALRVHRIGDAVASAAFAPV